MKVLIGLVVFIGALAAVLYFGGFMTMEDPETQANNFKAKLKVGMKWEDVAATHAPRKYREIKHRTFTGYGPETDFNAEELTNRLSGGGLPEGFTFPYFFAAEIAFEVVFDAKGKMVEIHKLMTFNDLVTPHK